MKLRFFIYTAVLGCILITSYLVFKLYKGNIFIWLPDYISDSPNFEERPELTDIIFVVVDHWEPGRSEDIVNQWMSGYRELADKHIDSDGIKLQHTWYYPLDQFRGYQVDSLVTLCGEGYGDVEVHLHHGNDNSESLRKILVDGIDSLQNHSALISPDDKTHFSFIHGNWALDNSRANEYADNDLCGVNNEISILLELGCYADFTFPAMGQTAQPSLVNKIYYCIDDPNQPKSHDNGIISKVGYKQNDDELMIFEGPYVIDWSDWRFKTHPTFDDGNMYWEIPSTIERFENWLSANVHVKDRSNWVFVRPFTHGADLSQEGAYSNILGENIDEMLTNIEKNYNNGKNYRLHYMTAREAYNCVKAAEQGLDGNPNQYRDFIIKPYLYKNENSR